MDPSPGVIEAQFKVLKNALHWDVDAVSKRNMRINEIDKLYPISGHDGEWLGVLGGAWGAFLRCTCVCVWVCVYVFARWCKYESGRRMQSSVILMLKMTIRGGLWENLRSTNGVVSSLKVTTSLPTSDRVTPHHITSHHRLGRQDLASEAEELISRELSREAAAFKYVRGLRPSVASDTALLKLAAILTHNVGDVDQGLNYWQVRHRTKER